VIARAAVDHENLRGQARGAGRIGRLHRLWERFVERVVLVWLAELSGCCGRPGSTGLFCSNQSVFHFAEGSVNAIFVIAARDK
jgi:hypothetical protein